jgi:hypothetical protein
VCVFCAVKLSVNLILEIDQRLDVLAGLCGTGEKFIIRDTGGFHSRGILHRVAGLIGLRHFECIVPSFSWLT